MPPNGHNIHFRRVLTVNPTATIHKSSAPNSATPLCPVTAIIHYKTIFRTKILSIKLNFVTKHRCFLQKIAYINTRTQQKCTNRPLFVHYNTGFGKKQGWRVFFFRRIGTGMENVDTLAGTVKLPIFDASSMDGNTVALLQLATRLLARSKTLTTPPNRG